MLTADPTETEDGTLRAGARRIAGALMRHGWDPDRAMERANNAAQALSVLEPGEDPAEIIAEICDCPPEVAELAAAQWMRVTGGGW